MMHPCIYCRELDVPRNEEHVFLDALKTRLTLTNEVCEGCNCASCPFDQEFLRALDFIYFQRQILRGLPLGKTKGGVLDLKTRISSRGDVRNAPQLVVAPSGEVSFVSERTELLQFQKELPRFDFSTITPTPVEPSDTTPRLTIVRSSPGTFRRRVQRRNRPQKHAPGCQRRSPRIPSR